MKQENEYGHLDFNPPLQHGTSRYYHACKLLREMNLHQTTVFLHSDLNIRGLTFESKEQAILFKLRLI